MARDLKPAEDQDRYGHYSPPREEVRPDGKGFGASFAWIYGDAIGKAPDGLIESALGKLADREKLLGDLLGRVERKHEAKIKELSKPLEEARHELQAAQILINNMRAPLAPVEYPEKAYGSPR